MTPWPRLTSELDPFTVISGLLVIAQAVADSSAVAQVGDTPVSILRRRAGSIRWMPMPPFPNAPSFLVIPTQLPDDWLQLSLFGAPSV